MLYPLKKYYHYSVLLSIKQLTFYVGKIGHLIYMFINETIFKSTRSKLFLQTLHWHF